jgi:hypothetical protein
MKHAILETSNADPDKDLLVSFLPEPVMKAMIGLVEMEATVRVLGEAFTVRINLSQNFLAGSFRHTLILFLCDPRRDGVIVYAHRRDCLGFAEALGNFDNAVAAWTGDEAGRHGAMCLEIGRREGHISRAAGIIAVENFKQDEEAP